MSRCSSSIRTVFKNLRNIMQNYYRHFVPVTYFTTMYVNIPTAIFFPTTLRTDLSRFTADLKIIISKPILELALYGKYVLLKKWITKLI